MKVLLIYRNSRNGFSIGKVFKPIENEIGKSVELDSIYMPFSGYGIMSMWQNIRFVRSVLKKTKFDIVHITGTEHYLIPFLGGIKVVVTIHDLGHYVDVKWFRRLMYKALHVVPLYMTDKLVCISQYTIKELKYAMNFVRTKNISVISDAVGPEFEYTKKEFEEGKPTIIHVGTRPHKNLIRTIFALNGIACHLRIVGVIDGETEEKLRQCNIEYSCVSNLSDQELLNEYNNSDIVNFPSVHEGFGMPIIEAQAVGRVVITSRIEPMRSVAGENAAFCDPYSIQSIREAYLKVINDKEYRQRVIESGLENVRKYSVENIAKQYIDLYKSLL